MKIKDALMNEGTDVRLSTMRRWLVLNEEGEFTVYSREYGQRKNRVLYKGEDEDMAIDYLLEREK